MGVRGRSRRLVSEDETAESGLTGTFGLRSRPVSEAKTRALALGLVCVLALGAVLVVAASRWGYAVQDREFVNVGTVAGHVVGTDDLGRDRAVRVAVALLVSLAGSVAAAVVATAVGAGVGVGAGFASSGMARVLLYGSDLLLTLPWLFLLMIVRAALPLNLAPAASAALTFVMLGALGWPVFARVNYARTRSVRGSEWMVNARAGGLQPWRMAWAHVLPHLRPVLLAQFLVYLPVCITAEANLGTLGLGISEPLPSWGAMLLALKSTAALSGTRWVYLPLALLVGLLLLLETAVYEEQ